MMSYGSGMVVFLKTHSMKTLHPLLAEYKAEVAGLIRHMYRTCPETWMQALSSRERPRLTLMSVYLAIPWR